MAKSLLDPESVTWRKENLRRFGSFKPHPGAEPGAREDDQGVPFPGKSGIKEFFVFHVVALTVVAAVAGPFILILMLMS